MRLIEMPTTTPGSEPPPAEGRVIFATREPREVRPHERASFPLTGHVARLTRLGQSRPTRRAANLWTIGFWHPHCVPARIETDGGGYRDGQNHGRADHSYLRRGRAARVGSDAQVIAREIRRGSPLRPIQTLTGLRPVTGSVRVGEVTRGPKTLAN